MLVCNDIWRKNWVKVLIKYNLDLLDSAQWVKIFFKAVSLFFLLFSAVLLQHLVSSSSTVHAVLAKKNISKTEIHKTDNIHFECHTILPDITNQKQIAKNEKPPKIYLQKFPGLLSINFQKCHHVTPKRSDNKLKQLWEDFQSTHCVKFALSVNDACNWGLLPQHFAYKTRHKVLLPVINWEIGNIYKLHLYLLSFCNIFKVCLILCIWYFT